ncbi:MAG: rhodanese-like domain-containing protein [Rhodospirillales bacterium]|nr:rhodanese-like domain-containing protein [Rhodospirillales bacterium]
MLGSSASQPSAPSTDSIRLIDCDTLQHWQDENRVVLVDVREAMEYQAGHIAGSTLVPLSRFDPGAIPAVPAGHHLVIHCRSGHRCGVAAALLLAAGYPGPVHRLEGGILAWASRGLPIVGGG